MNWAHLHLVLNHFPVLGVLFGLVVWGFGFARWNREIQKLGLLFFVAGGLFAVVAYLTGLGAHEVVHGIPEVPAEPIEAHESAALASMIAAILLGGVGAVTWWRSRTEAGPGRLWNVAPGALALVVTGMMIWTANLGGRIRHPEVESDWKPAAVVAHAHDGGGIGNATGGETGAGSAEADHDASDEHDE